MQRDLDCSRVNYAKYKTMFQQIKDGETKYQCHLCQKAFQNGAWTFVGFEFMQKKYTVGESHLVLNTLTTVSANSEDTRALRTQ